jgi:hypothetical protein
MINRPRLLLWGPINGWEKKKFCENGGGGSGMMEWIKKNLWTKWAWERLTRFGSDTSWCILPCTIRIAILLWEVALTSWHVLGKNAVFCGSWSVSGWNDRAVNDRAVLDGVFLGEMIALCWMAWWWWWFDSSGVGVAVLGSWWVDDGGIDSTSWVCRRGNDGVKGMRRRLWWKGDEKKTCDVLEIKEGKMLYSLKCWSKRV